MVPLIALLSLAVWGALLPSLIAFRALRDLMQIPAIGPGLSAPERNGTLITTASQGQAKLKSIKASTS